MSNSVIPGNTATVMLAEAVTRRIPMTGLAIASDAMQLTVCSFPVRRVAVARLVAVGLFAAGGLLGSPVAFGATYKWVDDKGVVHYTDKVPTDAVDRGNVEISKDGVALRKVDPALTAEQRRAREQEEERRKVVNKQQEDVARRDRALLASYASEGEIDLARNRVLNTIDAMLQSANAYSEQIDKRKGELAVKMATYTNRPVPAVFEREFESLNEELGRQAELVVIKRKEMTAVNARYDADKARWRELSIAKPPNGTIAAETPAAGRTTKR